MIFLETQRLLFRTHEPQDEPDFISIHTDPEVRRYVGGSPWPLEKARTRFRDEYLGRPKETYGLWATILKEEAKYIGCCGLRAGNKKGEAHLGYYLAQPYWRRGFASEASQAFIDVAFTRLRLVRLLADVEKGNDVSEHILRKLGFKFINFERDSRERPHHKPLRAHEIRMVQEINLASRRRCMLRTRKETEWPRHTSIIIKV